MSGGEGGEEGKYYSTGPQESVFFFCFILFCFVLLLLLLFRAAPAANGSSQARSQIRAAAAGLHLSSQQRQILNPLSEARDQAQVLIDTSRTC